MLLAGGVSIAQQALASHWDGQYYQSMLPVPADYRAPYDPNIDIVMAAIYGAIAVTDTNLLATAAQLRGQSAGSATHRATFSASSMSPPRMFHRSACSATTRSVGAARPPISTGGYGCCTGLWLQNAPVRWR